MKFSDRTFPLRHRIHAFRFALLVGLTASLIPALAWSAYVQTNLVSDIDGLAQVTDSNLVNPWGISHNSTGPFWVSDNGTGLSTLYNGSGQITPLVVTIPPPSGLDPSAPTGQVFNGGTSFGGAPFIFATEDGTIAAWNGGTSAVIKASTVGAIYKGLAISSSGSPDRLYATNFSAGRIDVFDGTFAPVSLGGGAFTGPTLPSGFAPFNIQNIGGSLYVTYAKQGPGGDDEAGAGNGFVDVFDLNGNFQKRLISQGALNSPWGLALAPSDFGEFSNDLLVGNFGDGLINAFNPITGDLIGTLLDDQGNPIVNQGLWGLIFGNGGNGGDLNKLYFTAGIPGDGKVEDHGLFGVLAVVPEPGTLALIATALLCLVLVPMATRSLGAPR